MPNEVTTTSNNFYSWIFFGVKLFGTIFISVLTLLYLNQDRILYIPHPNGFPKAPQDNPPGFRSPQDWNTRGRLFADESSNEERIFFEEKFVETVDGVQIHTWLLLQNSQNDIDEAPVPTLIYFHGNAGNMGFRLKNAAEMYAKVKVNILMMDYRGYGSSSGYPTEKGLNNDADAVLTYAINHPKLKNSPIIYFGRSLGGAVSISLAHRYPDKVFAVIVENTFMSISKMVDYLMPKISMFKGLVLAIKWDSESKIVELNHPILFISGAKDELVPPIHMNQLYRLAQNPQSKFLSIPFGTHNNTWEQMGYYQKIKEFIDEIMKSKKKEERSVVDEPVDTNNKTEAAIIQDETITKMVSNDHDDEEYDIISTDGISFPTMDRNFQVK